MIWLVGASLVFYGWWNPSLLALLLISIVTNYAFGLLLVKLAGQRGRGRAVIILGVAFNLALLGYFKYAGFFMGNLNWLLGTEWSLGKIILPLAISFFTFQQITFLVDAYKGNTQEYSFIHYCLFVTFFPQLIAGPIVHHRQMLPQFVRPDVFRPRLENLAVGMTIFAIGLFKKTVFADGMAPYVNPVWAAALSGAEPSLLEAWSGTVAFMFQIYFDFSGYSDMAIGLARMFGILLPLNFNSPLRAENIISLWQNWHMTLTRFLRDYLYFPLAGKRAGKLRRHATLIFTMTLCGLWHGASWTFVVFGALQGIYLVINYLWRDLLKALGLKSIARVGVYRWCCRIMTIGAFLLSGVFFRAETFPQAIRMLNGMVGLNGLLLPPAFLERFEILRHTLEALGWRIMAGRLEFTGIREITVLAFLMGIVWFAPNTQEMMAGFRPYLNAPVPREGGAHAAGWFQWRPALSQALVFGVVLFVGIHFIRRTNEFIYFQF